MRKTLSFLGAFGRLNLSLLLVVLLSIWPLMAQTRQLVTAEPEPLEPSDDLQQQALPDFVPISFEASNGFVFQVERLDGSLCLVGTDRYGESVTIQLQMDWDTLVSTATITSPVTIGEATLRTQHLADGTVAWAELELPYRETIRHDILAEQMVWSEQESEGSLADVPEWTRVDGELYVELAGYGQGIASEGYWADFNAAGEEFMAQLGAMYESDSCWWDCLSCIATLAGTGITFGALIAGCGGTFGALCWAAFAGWQVGMAGIVLSCTPCLECLFTPKDKDEQDPQGGDISPGMQPSNPVNG